MLQASTADHPIVANDSAVSAGSANADDGEERGHERLPERQRQARPRVLPCPDLLPPRGRRPRACSPGRGDRRTPELRASHFGQRAARTRSRRRRASNSSFRAMMPLCSRNPGRVGQVRLEQALLRPEVRSQELEDPGDGRGTCSHHSEDADSAAHGRASSRKRVKTLSESKYSSAMRRAARLWRS